MVSQTKVKPEFPTLYSPHPRANIAREWGTHSLEVRDKIHNGKEDGPPSQWIWVCSHMTLTRAINSASRMAGGNRLCTHKRTRVVRKRTQMTVRPDIWKKGRSAPDTTELIYMASVGIEPFGVTATA